MYFIYRELVLLGADGFIRDPQMGSQFRLFCFGLNIWIAWGDIDPDGNGYGIWTGLPKVSEVL
jgi:hypothetical protein